MNSLQSITNKTGNQVYFPQWNTSVSSSITSVNILFLSLALYFPSRPSPSSLSSIHLSEIKAFVTGRRLSSRPLWTQNPETSEDEQVSKRVFGVTDTVLEHQSTQRDSIILVSRVIALNTPSLPVVSAIARQSLLAVFGNRPTGAPEGRERPRGSMFTATNCPN